MPPPRGSSAIATAEDIDELDRYRLLVEQSADVIVKTRLGVIEWVSPAVQRSFGWTPAELIGVDWATLTHPDDDAKVQQARSDEIRGTTNAVRMRFRRADGEWRWTDLNTTSVHDAAGVFQGTVVAIVRDVHEAVLTERHLQRSTELLQASQAVAQVGGWEFDLRDRSVFVTDETHRILDTHPDEYVPTAENLQEFLTPGSRAKAFQAFTESFTSDADVDLELELVTALQRTITIRLKSTITFVGGQRQKITGVIQDITQRRRLEDQLRESQKLESLGNLAAGIAHDFNNVLGVMLGNVDLARMDLPNGHPAGASLDRIDDAGIVARNLIQQLLMFSRSDPPRFAVVPLQPIVESTVQLLRASLPAGVMLTLFLPPQPVLLTADQTQLGQVVMNLCTNAWQATETGDGLRIDIGLDVVTVEGPPAGRFAHLWVSDTGPGIDESTRARIFDPFFTTKPSGRGTGLGLGIARTIVESHGGTISVDSAPGRGATFHVHLPLAPAAPAAPD